LVGPQQLDRPLKYQETDYYPKTDFHNILLEMFHNVEQNIELLLSMTEDNLCIVVANIYPMIPQLPQHIQHNQPHPTQ
jgi:hypothetical protein